MIIQCSTFMLRPFRADDAPSIARHGNNKKIADNMRDRFPHPYTLPHAEAFVAMFMKNEGPYNNFVIEINGEAAGSIGFFREEDIYRYNAEIGYWIAEEYWGHGIATEALRAISKYAFDTTDIIRLHATPFPANAASARVLEKAGFIKEAVLKNALMKNGVLTDKIIYSLVRPLPV